MKSLSFPLILVLLIPLLHAGSGQVMERNLPVIEPEELLILTLPESNRSRQLAIDPIAQDLVLDTWQTPAAGDTVFFTGDEWAIWQVKSADEGWFYGPEMRGAYVYYQLHLDQSAVVLVEGLTHQYMVINSEPRIGNRYQYKEVFESWEPKSNYTRIPVSLNRGNNDFLFRCNRGLFKLRIHQSGPGIFLNGNDLTIPDLIQNRPGTLWGGLVLLNATPEWTAELYLGAKLTAGRELFTSCSSLPPYSVTKIPFEFLDSGQSTVGELALNITLYSSSQSGYEPLDWAELKIQVKSALDNQRITFISDIDGSVQYYSLNPAQAENEDGQALFFSMHGASVEAINQSGSYAAKTWGHIVAPTNRRPYGYNWEDWGRLDALEVFDLVNESLNIDPNKVYLTGHSMGGHGAWIHGVTYPDRFAALGPSAGWISFWSYRVRDQEKNENPLLEMIMRSTSPSNTIELASNTKNMGVFILHGSEDDNVLPDQAEMMIAELEKFHHDFIYHEEQGAGHWWDNSDEPGSACVDFAPMFDFFARHRRPDASEMRELQFKTANPGVSSSFYWAEIWGQDQPLEMSSIDIRVDPGQQRFVGSTENVHRLVLNTAMIPHPEEISLILDDQELAVACPDHAPLPIYLEQKRSGWAEVEAFSTKEKYPGRSGTFKDVFRNNVLLVVGTQGSDAENHWALTKARYDAESFWYQGNGKLDIILDTQFDPALNPDRNVVLYGNAETNAAWDLLLSDCPVNLKHNWVRVGHRKLRGDDLAVMFIYPRQNSEIASVGVVGGTGIAGCRLTNMRPYLYAGFAYPDLVVMDPRILIGDDAGMRITGFFGPDWQVSTGDFLHSMFDVDD